MEIRIQIYQSLFKNQKENPKVFWIFCLLLSHYALTTFQEQGVFHRLQTCIHQDDFLKNIISQARTIMYVKVKLLI